MSQPSARHPISNVFLLHVALEVPLAFTALYDPASIPFMQMNNTTLIILKMYAILSLSTCVLAILTMNLPEFLPGKRATVVALTIYHGSLSSILIKSERFIPISFGDVFEKWSVTPETTWGCVHGFLGLLFVLWWQVTLPYAQMARQAGQTT